jgi:hypothetical protein
MKLTKPKSFGNYELAEEGTTRAVVVDVIDMGMQPDMYADGKLVHKIRFSLQTEEETSEGKPFLVSTFPQKASLDSRSNTSKMIKTILDRDLNDDDYSEVDEDGEPIVDIDSLLIGKNVNVKIEHKEKGDKTYANVVEINPLSKADRKLEPLVPRDYIRVKDRPDKDED